ncbi:MAG: hypothetical protein ACP5JH_11010 [Bacteroidota bacterium]
MQQPKKLVASYMVPAAIAIAALFFSVWLLSHRQKPSQSGIEELIPKKGTSLANLRIVDSSGNERPLDFSQLQAPVLIAFVREVDCQSCVELVVSEFNRLSLQINGKKPSCVLIAHDGEFYKHLRMRYNTVFPIYWAARSQANALLFGLGSPCIIVADKRGLVTAARIVIPGQYEATEAFIDSVVAVKDRF